MTGMVTPAAFECPRCHALPGESCIPWPSGQPRPVAWHSMRIVVACRGGYIPPPAPAPPGQLRML